MLGKELNGRYRVRRRLGSGGMAVVFEARDLLLERDVALKILRTNLSSDADIVLRFKREARAVARLIHPHIVNIYDIGRDGELHFLVMEMITGGNLKEKIMKEGALDPLLAIGFMEQLCQALVAAHEKQIIHCDIKPHNLLLDQEERIKVTDFGIARALTPSTLTYTEGVVGSAHYLSPEQAQGEEVTARSDLYSAGVVFYEMVTGEVPFSGESPISVAIKHIDADPPPPSLKKDLPEAVEAIILRALKKEPYQRYPFAADMLQDLVAAKAKVLAQRKEEGGSTRVFSVHEKKQMKEKEKEVSGEKERPNPLRILRVLLITAILSSLVLVGSYIALRTFMQVPEVEVPSLLGLEKEEAQEYMEELGLLLKIGELLTSQEYHEGVVVAQYPKEGSVVKRNRTVIVDVSQGILMEEVPDFTGLTLREVQILFHGLELEFGEIQYQYHAEIPEGEVLSQDPLPGEELSGKMKLHLVLSQGELPLVVSVPNLQALSQSEAIQRLEEEGLREGNLIQRESLSLPAGRVMGQRPSSGEEISRGSPVDLIVSSGIKNPQGAPVKEHTLRFTPPISQKTEVTIIVVDNNGERLAYRQFHHEGDAIEEQIIGVGETTVRIYLDAHLFREEQL